MAKMFKIEAITRVSPYYTPEEEVKDMLRYDCGLIQSKKTINNKAILIIISKRYTKGRWDSFAIATKLLKRI